MPGIRKSSYVHPGVDRAAEDVHEQQHEHDRLHRVADQHLGLAAELDQVALQDHQRVGDHLRHRRLRLLLGRVAGEGEEHVVERRAGGRRCRRSSRPRRRARARRPRPGCPPGTVTSGNSAWTSSQMPRSASIAFSSCAGVAQRDLEPLAADSCLELVGGALGDHLAVVDHAIRSASRSASSRYCVVSRTVVPSATRASIVSHRPIAAARVQARGGLVEEERRAGARRARRRGPAGAACRRSRSSRAGRRRR